MYFFCVQSGQIYNWQIFLHGQRPWCPWQIWGMVESKRPNNRVGSAIAFTFEFIAYNIIFNCHCNCTILGAKETSSSTFFVENTDRPILTNGKWKHPYNVGANVPSVHIVQWQNLVDKKCNILLLKYVIPPPPDSPPKKTHG